MMPFMTNTRRRNGVEMVLPAEYLSRLSPPGLREHKDDGREQHESTNNPKMTRRLQRVVPSRGLQLLLDLGRSAYSVQYAAFPGGTLFRTTHPEALEGIPYARWHPTNQISHHA